MALSDARKDSLKIETVCLGIRFSASGCSYHDHDLVSAFLIASAVPLPFLPCSSVPVLSLPFMCYSHLSLGTEERSARAPSTNLDCPALLSLNMRGVSREK